jgi:hypothetical protein
VAAIAIAVFDRRVVLARYLFGISPAGPATLFACAGVMVAVAKLAVSIRASRSSRVDPLVALRYE